MKILFKYATRSRRSNFLRGIDSIVNNLINTEDYHILISCDKDDQTMNPLPELNCKHTYVVGKSESKIHAINRDIESVEKWDILVCMSDDMIFKQKGFDNIIRRVFRNEVQNNETGGLQTLINLDQFVHFPDGNRKDLCTMSIIGRTYYERDGYIYHPDYKSLYCDDEAQQVAKMRGCYTFIDNQIFEHLHPAYGKAHFDSQYQKTEAIGNSEDRQTFLKRKGANFGIS